MCINETREKKQRFASTRWSLIYICDYFTKYCVFVWCSRCALLCSIVSCSILWKQCVLSFLFRFLFFVFAFFRCCCCCRRCFFRRLFSSVTKHAYISSFGVCARHKEHGIVISHNISSHKNPYLPSVASRCHRCFIQKSSHHSRDIYICIKIWRWHIENKREQTATEPQTHTPRFIHREARKSTRVWLIHCWFDKKLFREFLCSAFYSVSLPFCWCWWYWSPLHCKWLRPENMVNSVSLSSKQEDNTGNENITENSVQLATCRVAYERTKKTFQRQHRQTNKQNKRDINKEIF